MKLSIIIVNWNTSKITIQCLESIYKYRPKFKFEVVVVDNASSDNSVVEIEKKFKSKNNFKLIKNTGNLGFAKGNNVGIENSKGEYKLLLNSDTKVTKGAIDKLVNFAKTHEDAGVVAARLLNKDGSVQASAFRAPTVWRNLKQWWFGKKILDKYYPNETGEVEIAIMAAFLITPRALKEVGLLNEDYFMFYEDYDYCREVYRAGLKIYYLVEAEVYHLHGVSGKKLIEKDKQWYRLINGSKIYHGLVMFYIIFFIQRSADIFRRRVLGR